MCIDLGNDQHVASLVQASSGARSRYLPREVLSGLHGARRELEPFRETHMAEVGLASHLSVPKGPCWSALMKSPP
ncbi:hypothetical protein VUR80DRAFT_5847 [Thermomyces stellatus]